MKVHSRFVCNNAKLKPPKCPSVGELWYVQPLEDSSVIKKERKMDVQTAWVDLEGIMLN